jgi:putative drug exporter of the RND superfamily
VARRAHRRRLAGVGLRGEPSDDFTIPGTESQRAVEQLQQKLPAFSGAQTQVTFAAEPGARLSDPTLAAGIDESIANLRSIPQIAAAAGPTQTRLVSPDGQVALGTVQWKAQPGEVDDGALAAVQAAMRPAQQARVRSLSC